MIQSRLIARTGRNRGKTSDWGGAGAQPPTGAIPASPTPREQPTLRASRTWLWAALGALVVFLLVGAAVWFAFLNPGQKGHAAPSIPITGSATASLVANSTVFSIPITGSSPTPAISPTMTITPTSTIAFTSTPSQITVLWDISHGPRVSLDGSPYTPDGMYKPLVQALAAQKFVFTSGGVSGLDSYSILCYRRLPQIKHRIPTLKPMLSKNLYALGSRAFNHE